MSGLNSRLHTDEEKISNWKTELNKLLKAAQRQRKYERLRDIRIDCEA